MIFINNDLKELSIWTRPLHIGIPHYHFVPHNVMSTVCNEENYRYGLNGQMKVNEFAGVGNHNTALFWEYDTRTGRRWNQDPVMKDWESPYLCFSGNPILINDKNGDDGKTAAVIATATQEAAGGAAATVILAPLVPVIEMAGNIWALYGLLKDAPVHMPATPKPLTPPAPTNQQPVVRKADSKNVEQQADSKTQKGTQNPKVKEAIN